MAVLTKITSNVTDISLKMMSDILLLLILILDIFLAQISYKKYFIDAPPVIESPLLLVSVFVFGGGADYAHHIGFVPPKIILLLRPCFR